ncbi:MAG TPA: hypothetical protein VGV61_08425 [Thermoanaerobaculia bacterium]|nr:hypothetical protein [Thermoanaerobaculia bacterium]
MSPKDPLEALRFALDKYPQKVELVPLAQLVTETARENERRPAWAKIALPDEVVKALRGGDADRDLVLLVRVPREVLSRAESSIVLPGEVK